MWRLLATSHVPINSSQNLSNKPYFCLGLLSNPTDILRPVDARSFILGIFHLFYPSRYGIPLGTLGGCREKQTFGKFDVFRNSLETGCLSTSDNDAPLLTGLSCTCYTDYKDVIIFLLFSGATLGT